MLPVQSGQELPEDDDGKTSPSPKRPKPLQYVTRAIIDGRVQGVGLAVKKQVRSCLHACMLAFQLTGADKGVTSRSLLPSDHSLLSTVR